MWSAGPVQFNLSTLLEWMAGLYRFFSSVALFGWVRYDLFECWPGVGGGAVQVSSGNICRSCSISC